MNATTYTPALRDTSETVERQEFDLGATDRLGRAAGYRVTIKREVHSPRLEGALSWYQVRPEHMGESFRVERQPLRNGESYQASGDVGRFKTLDEARKAALVAVEKARKAAQKALKA